GYQLSQIHLCVDIANFPLDASLLARLVTHSLKADISIPDGDEPAQATIHYEDDFDLWTEDEPSDLFLVDLLQEMDDELSEEENESDDEEDEGEPEEADEDEPGWEQGGSVVHLFGKQISGFSFSLSGALSSSWYDKLREERSHGKGWMQEIHERGG